MTFAILPESEVLEASTDRDVARRILASAAGVGFDDDRRRVLELVDAHHGIAERWCRPGHLTGSSFVVDPSRDACLLLFHTKLQRWLQPGGHADGDTNLARVALREAAEETGIDGLRVVVPAIDVDVHRVAPPKEDPHLHLDVRYLVLAPAGADPVGNHESEGLRWVTPAELVDFDVDDGLRRMAAAGFAASRRFG